MLLKKILVASGAMLLLSVGSPVAAQIDTDTIDELWGKPTLVYGGGLTGNQVDQVNQLFKVSNIDNVYRQVVEGKDLDTYIGTQGANTAVLFSSVLVQKTSPGQGVKVNILTPENITRITATQYENAAITAGAKDVTIDVAAPSKVTGESALGGVYVALVNNGEQVDQSRTALAQNEIATTAGVAEANSQNSEFNSTALDAAIAEVKLKLSEYKAAHAGIADSQNVEQIITDALTNNGLGGVLSATDIQSLVSFAEAYQTSTAIDDAEVKAQLEKYKNKVTDTLSNWMGKAKETAQDPGFWEGVSQFFSNLWESLKGLFGGNKAEQ